MFRSPRLSPCLVSEAASPAPSQAWETEQGKWVLIIACLGSMEPGALEGAGWCRRTLPGSLEGLCGGSQAELGAERSWEPAG